MRGSDLTPAPSPTGEGDQKAIRRGDSPYDG